MEETKKQCLCRPCEPCADALRDAITRARVGELERLLEQADSSPQAMFVVRAKDLRNRIREIKGGRR